MSLVLLALGQVVEPRVVECGRGGDAHLRAQLEHSVEQVQADLVDLGQNNAEILGSKNGEVGLVLGELGYAGPRTLRRGAHEPEDLLKLVLVCGAGEKRASRVHLGHDAACRPDVDACAIGPASQQDIGGTIPQGDNFVGEGVDRDTESTGETKISQLELTAVVDQKVLGLQITVKDAVVVAEGNTAKQLVHEGFDGGRVQGASITAGVHVSFEILVHELEDEHELVLGVDNIVEKDNVLVLQLLHKGDFTDGGGGGALFRIEVDFLESHELAGLAVAALEDLETSVSGG